MAISSKPTCGPWTVHFKVNTSRSKQTTPVLPVTRETECDTLPGPDTGNADLVFGSTGQGDRPNRVPPGKKPIEPSYGFHHDRE